MAEVKAPEAVPPAYPNDISLLSREARHCYDLYGIPYSLQAAMAHQGYVTLEDLADRWDDEIKARTSGPAALGFDAWDDEKKAFISMRLFQAVRHARNTRTASSGRHAILQSAGPPALLGSSPHDLATVGSNKRGHMEDLWKAKPSLAPPPQGLQGHSALIQRILAA